MVEDVVDELDAPEGGGGGGGPGGSAASPTPLVEVLLDELSLDDVASALAVSLDREDNRLCSCASSAADVSVDDVLVVEDVVDELDASEGGGGGGGPGGRSASPTPPVEVLLDGSSVDEVEPVEEVEDTEEPALAVAVGSSLPGSGSSLPSEPPDV